MYLGVSKSLEDLVDQVRTLPLRDQKDLAESIRMNMVEDGWELLDEPDGSFVAEKREIL